MICKLSSLFDILSGGTPKTAIAEYWGGDIPWLSVKDFNNGDRFVSKTEKTITIEGFQHCASEMLKPNDIIISARGTVGALAMISTPMAFNQSCFGLRAKKGVDPSYLYYLLKHSISRLKQITHGSVFDTLTRDSFSSVEVDVCDYKRQLAIAKVLSDIDDKIYVNNQINQNLLSQLRILYDSWFVKFDHFGGVRPANWKKSSIYSISNVVYGAPFSSKYFNDDGNGLPIVRIRDLRLQELTTYTTETIDKGYILKNGDIVVGMDGEFKPYVWHSGRAWLNQRVCVFSNKKPFGKAFLLETLRPLLEKVEKTQTGTTVIHIGKKDFDRFEVLIPDEDTLNLFDTITSPLFERYLATAQETKRLESLRQLLLPKLMSGEIDVDSVKIS